MTEKARELSPDGKLWKLERLRLALAGFENPSLPDPDMTLRVAGYDGAVCPHLRR